MRTEKQLAEDARAAGLDPYAAAERAAIMEYEGGLPRWFAEDYALGKIDHWRFRRYLQNKGVK